MKISITATTLLGQPRGRIKVTNGTRATDERSIAPRYEYLTIEELQTLIFQAAGTVLRLQGMQRRKDGAA